MVDLTKRELRRAARASRRALTATRDRAQDARDLARLVNELVDHLRIGPGGIVAAYDALPTEPPTAEVIARLQDRGVQVVLPILLLDNDLDWCDAADPHRRPRGREAITGADLILTPGLAVDAVGTRLGQGGGSYDRALARRAHGIPVVALLHPGEDLAPLLPREPHDEPVDGVITAEGIRWLKN